MNYRFSFILFFNFTILYWFCHTIAWIHKHVQLIKPCIKYLFLCISPQNPFLDNYFLFTIPLQTMEGNFVFLKLQHTFLVCYKFSWVLLCGEPSVRFVYVKESGLCIRNLASSPTNEQYDFIHLSTFHFLIHSSNTVCMCAHLLQLIATLWTVAYQASLSVGFSRQEYWSGLPFPTPGNLPNQGIERSSLALPSLAGGFFATEPSGNLLCL